MCLTVATVTITGGTAASTAYALPATTAAAVTATATGVTTASTAVALTFDPATTAAAVTDTSTASCWHGGQPVPSLVCEPQCCGVHKVRNLRRVYGLP